ncbi:MAG: alanine racemase, partial [Actinobacteria bacterium]|nr:alanine racemase [Actinomycetota bacterium]
MGLTLYVDTAAWRATIDRVRRDFPDLIPVVKGNGYGFGRAFLAEQAAAFGATEVAVGTVFELGAIADVPLRAIVLTPSLDLNKVQVPESAALTVGSF